MKFPNRMIISDYVSLHPGLYRTFFFSMPFFLGFLLVLALRVIYDTPRFFQIFGLVLLYFIPPAGKESLIPAGIALGFPWQVICFAITYIDVISCLFMLWNFDLICLIPHIGRWINHLVETGKSYLSRHQWIERFCFIGLISFVFLPLQGSGAVGGSILGKILGMSHVRIFLAITIGSTLHSVAIGISMYAIQEYLDINLWYLVISILLLVLLTSTLSFIYYFMKKKIADDEKI